MAFSWGYWGWGNTANEFARAADALEKARGFRLPCFVDVRFSRSVRAPAFRDRAFELSLPAGRYVWMKELGNKNFRGGRIALADRQGVDGLLDVIIRASKKDRRVLYFCSCESPNRGCHRHTVTKALITEAGTRQIRLAVEEWPGTRPTAKIDLRARADDACMDALSRELKWVPLPARIKVADVARLPFGGLLQFEHNRERKLVIGGQISFRNNRWCVKRISCVAGDHDRENLLKIAVRERKHAGLPFFVSFRS